MRILWLLPDFGFNAASRQARLVVPELIRLGNQVAVAALRAGGGMVGELRECGIPLRELASPADMPVKCLFELEKLLKDESFDLAHTWRLPAARSLGTLRLARAHRPRLLVSHAKRGAKWNPLDRLLLGRVDKLTADPGEPGPQMPMVPLAVAPTPQQPWPKSLVFPADARVIVCMGELTSEHLFKDAIWAFDVLKYVYPELHLLIIGKGPDLDGLVKFARSVSGASDRIHFLTDWSNGPALLANAEMVWIPSRKRCGEQVALEAQVAGVPVVATNLPGLAAVLGKGESGILVTPNEPVELAKAARPVLDDPARRKQLIEAGRQNTSVGYSPAEVAARWAEVYAEVAAKGTSA